MLTLTEAVAKYRDKRGAYGNAVYLVTKRRQDNAWGELAALDAAFRDVALACSRLFPRPHSDDCHCSDCNKWESARVAILAAFPLAGKEKKGGHADDAR